MALSKSAMSVLDFDPIEEFATALRPSGSLPWDNIIDFATHSDFCGLPLYPRQKTLLKLIHLETDIMTAYDIDVIEQWREGWRKVDAIAGVQEDIWERIHYLKERGYRHFPHVEALIGRRGSKGLIGGVIGAEKIAQFHALDDWQEHYGVARGKDGYLSVVATSLSQAKKFQFADIRQTIESCKYLERSIVGSSAAEVLIRTPADSRRIADMMAKRIPIDRVIATLHIVAMSSNSSSGRGGTGFANFYDEFAHMVSGTGSQKSSEEIYEAYQPSLDQFKKHSLTYIPTSPFCLEPSTPVLTEDLRWVPVGSLVLGDKLIGFDEHAPKGAGKGRTWQPAEVTETSIIQAPRYKITMESGKEIVSTSEHMWLTSWGSQVCRWDWRKTGQLQPGDRIKSMGVDPWEQDDSQDAGYLAGFFDGEGYYSKTSLLGAGQNKGAVLDHVLELLAKRDFDVATDEWVGEQCKFRIRGGIAESMRFLGTVRPERLLPKFAQQLYGTRIYGRANPAVDRVASVEYLDDGPVVALGTSTDTLVADGLLSHNTKVGKAYSLYKRGSVLMRDYDERTGRESWEMKTVKQLGTTREEQEQLYVELSADPEKLIVQLPSWGLYEDYEKSTSLGGHYIKEPIQAYDERLARDEAANPDKFAVERRAQFASVLDAYLNPRKVEAMFVKPEWRELELGPASRGRMDIPYRIHCDPSLTNANFAVTVAHLENAPVDEYGEVWPHVVVDFLHVWKPEDFPDNTIDYVEVTNSLKELLERFPSTTTLSFDQWNSAGPIATLRKLFSPRIRIAEETFGKNSNDQRMERFKTALNLGWIHAYRDSFFGDEEGGEEVGSLLEMELKFLQRKANGKVDKQDFGPVTTKDLADTLMVVTDKLLGDALDRWYSLNLGTATTAIGSTDAAGIRSGREAERMGSFGGNGSNLSGWGNHSDKQLSA